MVEEIEPRILYSADFAPGLVAAAPAWWPPPSSALWTPAGSCTHQLADPEPQPRDRLRRPGHAGLRQTDRGHPRQAGAERDIEVVLLDANKDGVKQISQALAKRSDISAVHLVSHGSDGAVQLGSSTLDFDSLLKNASKIKGWGNALSGDADILIYGCDVAASPSGEIAHRGAGAADRRRRGCER